MRVWERTVELEQEVDARLRKREEAQEEAKLAEPGVG